MQEILKLLQDPRVILGLIFIFLVIAAYLYFRIMQSKRPTEKMRDPNRVLKLTPLNVRENDEVSETKAEEKVEGITQSPLEMGNDEKEEGTLPHNEEQSSEDKEINDEGDDKFSAIKYSYSYFAHVSLSPRESRVRYNLIKNEILKYDGVISSITWKEERFIYVGKTIIKFRLMGNVLRIYLALNNDEIKEVNIKSQDLSHQKEHERTPSLIRISGNTGVKRALEAINLVMKKLEIKDNPAYQKVDFVIDDSDFNSLLNEGHIRKL